METKKAVIREVSGPGLEVVGERPWWRGENANPMAPIQTLPDTSRQVRRAKLRETQKQVKRNLRGSI